MVWSLTKVHTALNNFWATLYIECRVNVRQKVFNRGINQSITQRHKQFLVRSSVLLILSKQKSFTIAFEDIIRESRISKVVQ